MIKTLIIEDEHKASEMLKNMLLEIEPEIEVVEICEDLPSAVKSIKRNKPELVFLDVQLPLFKGLQLLEFLNPEDVSFKIIFTTASDEHALRAFEMSAIDYVLKPIQYDKLKAAVTKFIQFKQPSDPDHFATLSDNFSPSGIRKIVVSQNNGFEIINLDDITLIKAEGSYAKIFLKNGKSLIASNNVKHYEDLFRDEHRFIRIHRSYLVNIHHAKRIIKSTGYLLVMEDDTQLTISAEKLDTVFNYFNLNKRIS